LAAALAFIAERADPGHGMARLGAAIVAVIVVSGIFAHLQERRIERTLTALRKLLPSRAATLRGGELQEAEVDTLVPGDVLALAQGDIVPADCRVIEAIALRVSMVTFTGETAAQVRSAAPVVGSDPMHCANLLLAGSAVVSGQARAVVYATAGQTELGRIALLTLAAPPTASPLQRELARLSRLIGALALAIGALCFAAGAAMGLAVWQDMIFSIGVIVAMVPEGLLPTLTLSLVLATQRMARRQVLVRHLASIETLGCVSVICTDKTGTLTANKLRARELLLAFEPVRIDALREMPAPQTDVDLFTVARMCNELRPMHAKGGGFIGDPTEIALVELADLVGRDATDWELVDALPFDSDRMRQSMIYATPAGRVVLCKGAPEAVLRRCATAAVADGQQRDLDDAARQAATRAAEQMAERGLRVLAFAWRPLRATEEGALEDKLIFLGLVGLEDPPREQVADALQQCRTAGIRVVMITGDHPRTAAALARQVGLASASRTQIVTGEQLEQLSNVQLEHMLQADGVHFARTTARHKLRIVEALKSQGHVVAVTGDGVNDAPALKAAHIGVAMGICGADVAREAADIVLLDDNFASIVDGIREGRAVFDNIRKFLTYVLTHNVAELVPFLVFALARIPLPLTPIQALAIDMGTDSLTALGLGAEPAEAAVMQRPPRPRSESLLSIGVALRAYLFLGPLEAAAAMAAYFYVLGHEGWRYGLALSPSDPRYLRATTACMAAIIAMQLANVYLCRSATASVLHTGVGGNRWIAAGLVLALSLMFLIAYTPLGNAIFGTAPLPPRVWLLVVPLAFAMVGLEELRKALARRLVAAA
jgi:calcium-translocating P-type ATPase